MADVSAVNNVNPGFSYGTAGAVIGAIAGGLTGYKRKTYLEDGALSDVFVNSAKQTMPAETKEILEQMVESRLPEALQENRYYAAKFRSHNDLQNFVQMISSEYTPQGVFEKLKQGIAQNAENCKKHRFFNKISQAELQTVERIKSAATLNEIYDIIHSLDKKEMKTLGRKLGSEFRVFCAPSLELVAQEITNIGSLNFADFVDKEITLINKLLKKGSPVKTASETAMLDKMSVSNPVSFVETIANGFFEIADQTRSKIISSYFDPASKSFVNTSDNVGSYMKKCAAKMQLKNSLWYAVGGAAIVGAVGYLIGDYKNSKTQIPAQKS